MFAAASLIISCAGANSIWELLALYKPNILIPLSASASRSDRILNACSFEKQGFSFVIEEEQLSADSLKTAIREVTDKKAPYICAMKKSTQSDSIDAILKLIESAASVNRRKRR